MKPILPNSSRKEERRHARHGRYAVGVVFLLVTALATGDLLEVAPYFAALVRHPLFPFFHEAHDLLALIVALYAAHWLGPTVGQWAVVWFLALHAPYFYLTLPTELPEFARFVLLVLVASFGVHIITLHHRLEGQLNSLAATLETQRAAEACRAQEADTLRQAGAVVAATLRPGEAIERILEQLMRVVPYDSASVLLWAEAAGRPGEGHLEIVGGRGWPDPAVVVGLHFPVPGDNPNTAVIQQRRPHILGDAPAAHAPFREDPHNHIHSWLGVPLIVRERVIGMLAVDSARSYYFTSEHARLASAFADQVGIAIENARLVEAEHKRLEELTVLYTLATAGVEATNVDTLITHAIQIIGDILHPDYFGVGLVDEAAGVLRVCRSTQKDALIERLTVPMEQGVTGQVVATGVPRRISDVSREPVYLPVNLGTRSELCVPLVGAQRRDIQLPALGPQAQVNLPAPVSGGQRVIGVINIESTGLNAFSEADEHLMTAFAGQLATAIEKVRLFQAEQRRREAAAALLEIAEVAGSSLELVQVLKLIARQTAKACRANRSTIFLLDEAGEFLRPVMSQFADGHANPEQWQIFKATTADRVDVVPLFRDAIRKRRPTLLDDAMRTDLVPLKWTQPFSIQRMLAVPLVSHDRVIGLMALDHTDPRREFTPEQIDLALTIGGQVATSIENAQLYAQAQQRLDELRRLHQAGQALSADLSFEAVLNAVADHLIAALEVESCTISSWDVTHNELVTLLDRDPEPTAQVPTGSRFRLSDYPYYSVLLRENRPLVFQRDEPTLDGLLRRWLDAYRWRSLLTVPLLNKGQVIGLIELGERRRERGFTTDETRLAESLASQAAVAIENARLYAEAQRRAEQLHALHEASRALASDLHLESILHTLVEAARRLTNARYGALAVLDTSGNLARFYTLGLTEADQQRIGEPPRGQGLLGVILRDGIPMRVDDLARHPRTAGFPLYHPLMKSFLGAPIAARGKVIGSLYLTDKANDRPFTQEDEDVIVGLAADAAIAIENARLFGEVQQLAITDSLTGLHNRHHFFELAEHEFQRARRYGRALSVIMLDIDHFKQVNDTYSHAVGDQVLRVVAERCRESLRDIDFMGRYGGEEFAVLLPESDTEGARNAAERLRRCVAESPVETARGRLSVTISLGVVTIAVGFLDLVALLDRADAAMYAAKKAGRNRVETMK